MKKGFTLIEFLVVMVIISILILVVSPIAVNALKKARATNIGRNLRNIHQAVQNYINVEQPSSLDNLTINYLRNKKFLKVDMDENDFSKYNFNVIDLETKILIETVYKGKDIDPLLVIKLFPFIKATDNVLYIRTISGKWWKGNN